MSKVEFKILESRTESAIVESATGRVVANHSTGSKMGQKHLEVLNAEHVNGRKAQAFCTQSTKMKPVACDYDRVFAPELLTAQQRAALVLCEHHEARLAQRMAGTK